MSILVPGINGCGVCRSPLRDDEWVICKSCEAEREEKMKSFKYEIKEVKGKNNLAKTIDNFREVLRFLQTGNDYVSKEKASLLEKVIITLEEIADEKE